MSSHRISIDPNDIIICVEWYTECNLKCDFCYNFLNNTITENHSGNFDIVPYFNHVMPKQGKIFMEAGGELLLAPYFIELMRYKQQVIENYKGYVFTNGEIPIKKFNTIIKELYKIENVDMVISPHIEDPERTNGPRWSLKFIIQNIITTYKYYGYVNLNLVVTEEPKKYLGFLEYLKTLNLENIYINIGFDYRIFEPFNITEASVLNKFKIYKTITFIKSYKECFDFVRDNFKFLNYGREPIIDKFSDIEKIFDMYNTSKLDKTSLNYNPSASFFINKDEVEIHYENETKTIKIKEIETILSEIKIDNSNVSDSELLTFSICNY